MTWVNVTKDYSAIAKLSGDVSRTLERLTHIGLIREWRQTLIFFAAFAAGEREEGDMFI